MKIELNVSTRLILTPQLRTAIDILQMTALELHERVQSELEENPFLEEDESDRDETKDDFETLENRSTPDPGEMLFADSSDTGFIRKTQPSGDSNFLEGVLTRPDSLKEQLMWQLRLSVPDAKQFAIGEMLIGNISDDGFLTGSLEELVNERVSLKEIETVLAIIQTFEPYGIGARDLRESLLIQIKYASNQDQWVERILRNHFDLLKGRKKSQIARRLGVTEKVVDKSLSFIATLNPNPGREVEDIRKNVVYVVPDVIIREVKGVTPGPEEEEQEQVTEIETGAAGHSSVHRYEAMITDPWVPKVTLNTGLLNSFKKQAPDQRQFMNEKFNSAYWLMRSIEQRRITIKKVVESIIRYQRKFFEKGIKYISPLTLRTIADNISMHESTISRVTRGKYVQTPWGIFELKYFFSSKLRNEAGEDFSSRSVKEIIKDIVENENVAFSDLALVSKLKDIGVQISRRTVTKYRKHLNILPSYLRKK